MAKSHSMGLEELIEVLSDALKCKKDEVFDKISIFCDSLIEAQKNARVWHEKKVYI